MKLTWIMQLLPAGSVLPIFMDQLEHGQPLTVTHEDMTRFFMTIAEASWLILDAAAIGGPGDLFVLDMGKPVRIMDLVTDLVRLSGRPAGSVPIRITGLRPGEKLHERLFYASERPTPTSVPKIMRASAGITVLDIRENARSILALATGTIDGALRDRLFAVVDALAGTTEAPVGQDLLWPETVEHGLDGNAVVYRGAGGDAHEHLPLQPMAS